MRIAVVLNNTTNPPKKYKKGYFIRAAKAGAIVISHDLYLLMGSPKGIELGSDNPADAGHTQPFTGRVCMWPSEHKNALLVKNDKLSHMVHKAFISKRFPLRKDLTVLIEPVVTEQGQQVWEIKY
jgi:hypothetical protein